MANCNQLTCLPFKVLSVIIFTLIVFICHLYHMV